MAGTDNLQALVDQASASGQISESAAKGIGRWLSEAPFAPYRERLAADILAGNWRALDDAFYAVLEFGTGGRRGRMYPVGTNVLNARTMAESARGLADYVAGKLGPDAPKSCAVAHDTRHNSPEFARLCARVLAAAGFTVYLFDGFRSTPLLSFAVRHLGCDAGIMITASHNPPSDNGFKCYAATGGQVVPPDDSGIIACVEAASSREIPEAPDDDPRIKVAGPEVDEAYIRAAVDASVSPARDLSIVYTPMHGVGETSVAATLKAAGFDRVDILASQRTPDGDFPNVPGHVSNPEIPKTLQAAIEQARAIDADLVLASDPDADRIGVGLPVTEDRLGEWTTLNGNQIGALLAAFVLEKSAEAGKIGPDSYLVTTLVTTQMARALAKDYGVRVEDDLLVGFKWIGVRIDEAGPEGFLFGFEESHGYLRGTYARDKDAAVASLLFAELAADLKARGKTVLGYLDDLYRKAGHYGEALINKTLEGRAGAEQIRELMAAFRERPPLKIGGLDVVEVRDYKAHEIRPVGRPGEIRPLPEPSGDLLIFHLDAPDVRFAARPSGTEPKIKFYLFARTPVDPSGDLGAAKAATAERLAGMARDIDDYVRSVVSG